MKWTTGFPTIGGVRTLLLNPEWVTRAKMQLIKSVTKFLYMTMSSGKAEV